jgi:hypothetical protein
VLERRVTPGHPFLRAEQLAIRSRAKPLACHNSGRYEETVEKTEPNGDQLAVAVCCCWGGLSGWAIFEEMKDETAGPTKFERISVVPKPTMEAKNPPPARVSSDVSNTVTAIVDAAVAVTLSSGLRSTTRIGLAA